jgi:hypothetical protein
VNALVDPTACMHAHSLAVAHITAPAMLRVAGPALDSAILHQPIQVGSLGTTKRGRHARMHRLGDYSVSIRIVGAAWRLLPV